MLAGQLEYRFGIGQVRLTPRKEFLLGRLPTSVSLGVKASWKANAEPIYQGQAKVTLPIIDGIEIPVLFSVASRTDRIDETEARGHVGFLIDASRLLAGATSFLTGR